MDENVSKVIDTVAPIEDVVQSKLLAFVAAHPKTTSVIMVAEAIAILVFYIL